MRVIIDQIAERAAENAFAPAFISQIGSISFDDLLDTIVKISNLFDDRRLPRQSRAYLNIREPELRIAVTLAALDYGLVPAIAAPETLKRDFDYDLTIGARLLSRPDIRPDIVIDETVLAGKLADGKRRQFPQRGDDELALLSETTGTTGYPKLLATTSKSLLSGWQPPNARRFEPGARAMFAIGGVSRYAVNVLVATLVSGAPSVAAPVDPISALRMIALYEVTDILTTPMGITRIVEVMERAHARAPSVRRIALTGSLTSQALLRRIEASFASGTTVDVRYGTSEALRLASAVVTSATFQRGYVGEIRKGVTIVSAGNRAQPAPIVIANNLDYATQYIVAGKIVVDDRPTVTLPDLGFVEGTSLYLTGRADEVFNFSGNKLPYDLLCQEIERSESIRDVGVAAGGSIGRDDDIIIAVAADKRLDLTNLADRVVQALGWGKARDHFLFFQVAEVPRNAMGKVDREQLLKSFQATRLPTN